MEQSEHEIKFIKEYSKRMVLAVCFDTARKEADAPIPEPYLSMMLKMGLLRKAHPHLPTAKGWKTATSLIKRTASFKA